MCYDEVIEYEYLDIVRKHTRPIHGQDVRRFLRVSNKREPQASHFGLRTPCQIKKAPEGAFEPS